MRPPKEPEKNRSKKGATLVLTRHCPLFSGATSPTKIVGAVSHCTEIKCDVSHVTY